MSVRAPWGAVGFVNPEMLNMMGELALKFPDNNVTVKRNAS